MFKTTATLFRMIALAGTVATGQGQLPNVVTPAPAGDQRIIQPAGTTLGVNNLNGIVNASLFPGGDIGVQLNNAIAAVSATCGKVMLPPGSYRLTTQVMKPRCVWIEGNNAKITSAIENPKIPAIVTGSIDAEAHP